MYHLCFLNLFIYYLLLYNVIENIKKYVNKTKEMHLRMRPTDTSSVNGASTTFLAIL
jgi:hypothetical protein